MQVEAVELRRIRMPLVRPFRTSFGVQSARHVLLVRVFAEGTQGWGECAALSRPVYSSEYVDTAYTVVRDVLAPAVLDAGDITSRKVAHVLGPVLGHRMAKAALEMAVLDAELRVHELSLARFLGAVRDRVDCGVSVGIADSVEQLLEEVRGYVEEGYRRIKLKIEPGWDRVPVEAVREEFGDDLPLQVDANAAYGPATVGDLEALDDHGLLLLEQPFEEEDLRLHAELAARMRTPICLDESITSARAAAEAIRTGSCRIVNIKAGRVGGYLEAVRVHDVAQALGAAVWCGGMLETGIGRAANVALAALPNFSLPGDTSASGRYYAEDITAPFVLEDGRLPVPDGPGLGVDVRMDVVEAFTAGVELVRR